LKKSPGGLKRFIAEVLDDAAASGGIMGGAFPGTIRYDEPLASHTTFRVGGPADCWVRPCGAYFPVFAASLLRLARRDGIAVFMLGGGANLVVSDRGIRGIVLDMGGWTGAEVAADGNTVLVRSGTNGDFLADGFAGQGLGGLEFLAGMPGSVGGMVWMNARAMEMSVSSVLVETEIIDEALTRMTLPARAEDFSYKKSPFQNRGALILAARFALTRRPPEDIRRKAALNRAFREERGHFRAPSAGSVFKNNRAFGKPSGQIIDELGLRGLSVGGAEVAPWHGNFIVNTGNASAADIRALVDIVIERVRTRFGFVLEPELIFAGEWD
jgi:UDP-N-acetylmuramate dehydrogenase